MIGSDAIEVRPYSPHTDHAFIFSTWLRNYKHSSYFAKRIKPSVFFAGHQKMVAYLLQKPEVQALIAHPKDDPDTILGYLVFERGERAIVHFTFVKDAFRKLGIARALFTKAAVQPNESVFTHWTFPVDELIRKYPDMTYDPYRL